MYINYLLKLTDVKVFDVQKALEQAGIKVRSIIELHREEEPETEEATTKKES